MNSYDKYDETTDYLRFPALQSDTCQNKIGEIRGFNQPEVAYPGMSRDQILRKASELGLNSVRSWIGGNTVEEQIAFIREYVEDASKYGLTFSPVLSFYGRYYYDNSIPEEERRQA